MATRRAAGSRPGNAKSTPSGKPASGTSKASQIRRKSASKERKPAGTRKTTKRATPKERAGRGPGGTGGTSGVRDGLDTTYYQNGQVREQGQRVAGEKHGPWIAYHKDGKPWSNGTYDHGVAHGVFSWYADNGVLRQEGSFDHGVQTGRWRRFRGGTGVLFDEGEWRDGKRVGEWVTYDANGAVKKRQTFKV